MTEETSMAQPVTTGHTSTGWNLNPRRGHSPGRQHIDALVGALTVLDTRLLDDWGQRLAVTLRRGGRLLTAGNGGSAAEAQHLAAEFTGRFAADRAAYSAIALHAETSTVTAIANDYGYDEVFARQVRAHGRPGDVLLAMSTSGRSRNLLRAVTAAKAGGIATWCLTGPAPNPLAEACDEAVCVYPAGARALALTATVQEAHQVALHLICLLFDAAVLKGSGLKGDGATGDRLNSRLCRPRERCGDPAMSAVLGINAVFHDPAAALVVDGEVVAAAEEERFTRRKHGKKAVPFSTWELPVRSAEWCLRAGHLTAADLDAVAYSYDPALAASSGPALAGADVTANDWEGLRTLYAQRAPLFLRTALPGLDPAVVRFVPHHLAHAASTALAAPFPDSAVLVCDGRGEARSHWAGVSRAGDLTELAAQPLPDSLGLMYEDVTEHLGFRRSSDEYKVMALAAYGTPTWIGDFRELIYATGDGGFRVHPVD